MGPGDLVSLGHRSNWETMKTFSSATVLTLLASLFILAAESPQPSFLTFAFWNISCIICLSSKNSSGICVLSSMDAVADKTDKLPDLVICIFWWEETRTNKHLLGERCYKEPWGLMHPTWLYPPGYVWEWDLPHCLAFCRQGSGSESHRWPLGRNIVSRLWLFFAVAIVLKRTDEGGLPGRVPR